MVETETKTLFGERGGRAEDDRSPNRNSTLYVKLKYDYIDCVFVGNVEAYTIKKRVKRFAG